MELPVKIGIISGVTFVFILCFGWIAFPAILKHGVKKKLTLANGTDLREMWSNVPFPLEFKVYIFNVTNARDVHNGDTPVLDEIGPYVYEEWKQKVNLVDNETDDTVSFNQKTRWYFNQKKSGQLTGNELVTVPHPVVMTLLLATALDRPPMISMVYKAVNGIFNNPSSIFVTAPAKDILFDGLYINCNISDFIPHAACFELKQEKSLKHVDENGLLFSFFGYKNESVEDSMKVKRGIENYLELNNVAEFRNGSHMKIWSTKECNTLRGTESSVFHPLIGENEPLLAFASLLCRTMTLNFDKKADFHGLKTAIYTTSYGDMSKNENEKCYCPKNNYCLKKGAMDLTRCMGAPIVVTYPHFYDADDSYLEAVRGLRPNGDSHKSQIYFEPIDYAEPHQSPRRADRVLIFQNNITDIFVFPHLLSKIPSLVARNILRTTFRNWFTRKQTRSRRETNRVAALRTFLELTGAVVAAKNRIQFNFHLRQLKNVTIMQSVPDSLLPIMWIEESMELNSTYIGNIEQLFLVMRINNIIKWVVLCSSLIGLLLSIYMHMNKNQGFSLSSTFPVLGRDIVEPKKSNVISTLSNMIDKESNDSK